MTLPAVIIGIDEAGRGPLAGPVVAGACHVPHHLYRRRGRVPYWSPSRRRSPDEVRIGDSKTLNDLQRERAYAWITTHCLTGWGMRDAATVDTQGILAATEAAMQDAVAMLARTITPTYLLVDGRDAFWFDYPHSSVVRGDSTEPCIAAASIVAKVTRDRWMRAAATQYPHYGFQQHKGYGTAAHHAALLKHGPCPLHRLSFLHADAEPAPRGQAQRGAQEVSAADRA